MNFNSNEANDKLEGGDELDQSNSNSNAVDYKYQQEIAQMMFVFGDVTDPQPAVVQLVEDIVRSQVIEMVIQSKKLASRRSSKYLSPEDLLFLIRYDRAKVNRLRTYLSWKDVRKKAKDSEPGAGGGDPDVEVEDVAENAAKMAPKQVKLPWDLSSLYSEHLLPFNASSATNLEGGNMEDLDEPDEDDIEAHEDSLARLRQADEATKGMTKEEYVHYSDCRQASFTFKKAKKFREFIASSNYLEVKPNDDIIDVLGFLAFEVVRELCVGAVELKKQEEEEIKRLNHQDEDLKEDPESGEKDENEAEGDEEDEDEDEDEDQEETDDTIRENNGDDSKLKDKKDGEKAELIGNDSVETTKGDQTTSSVVEENDSKKRKSDQRNSLDEKKGKKSKSNEDDKDSSSSSSSLSPLKSKSNVETKEDEGKNSKNNSSNFENSNSNSNPTFNSPLSSSITPSSPLKKHKKKSKKKEGKTMKDSKSKNSSSKDFKGGPFCSLFLPPEVIDKPLLPNHIARAFSRLQKSNVFLQSSRTVMGSGGGLRRTKVFVM